MTAPRAAVALPVSPGSICIQALEDSAFRFALMDTGRTIHQELVMLAGSIQSLTQIHILVKPAPVAQRVTNVPPVLQAHFFTQILVVNVYPIVLAAFGRILITALVSLAGAVMFPHIHVLLVMVIITRTVLHVNLIHFCMKDSVLAPALMGSGVIIQHCDAYLAIQILFPAKHAMQERVLTVRAAISEYFCLL